MFKVTSLNQNNENKKLITSGLTFGFFDYELLFKIEMDGAEEPLIVKFLLNKNKNKKDLEIEIGAIKDNTLTINYYNPPSNGSCGITAPLSIVQVDNNLLALMFQIDILPESPTYKFSYEFYHGILPNNGSNK